MSDSSVDKPITKGPTVDKVALDANFAAVKGTLQCSEVAELEAYVDLHKQGDGSLRGFCPLHSGDSRSFYCYQAENGRYERWYCHRCATGGDVIDLYGAMRGITNSLWAMQELARAFNLKLWGGEDFQTEEQKRIAERRKQAERRIWRAYEELAFEKHIMPIIMVIGDEEERARTLRDCLRAAGLERGAAGQ